jgi:hypothetical protein
VIKPWQHRSWIFPRAPYFALKGGRVLDLYQREWEGRSLGSAEPYASAKRVFWVVGNGASHRNWAAAARLSDAYPNAQMVHLPVHASWLNQVEVYLSVIKRKLLTPDDFGDLDGLAEQILAFEKHYNAAAQPFDWRFTRTDLNRLLVRLGRHDPFAPHSGRLATKVAGCSRLSWQDAQDPWTA